MGVFDFLKKDVRREHLLLSPDGTLPIEKIKSWSASKKIDYAWAVYNHAPGKYDTAHRDGALEFLKRQFQIPQGIPLEQQLEHINVLIKRKKESLIPSFADLGIVLESLPRVLMNKLGEVTWPSYPPAGAGLTQSNFIQFKNLPTSQSFVESVNEDIKRINILINSYNSTRGEHAQIGILQKIDTLREAIENKYSGKHIELCPAYRDEIQSKLFNELREQSANIGLRSVEHLNSSASSNRDIPRTPSLESFSTILANMKPERVSTLLAILLRGEQFKQGDQLKRLYARHETGYKEFQDFLRQNSIDFLGGGNSKNFKITPLDGSPPYVLKVDNRLNMPKGVEAHLRTHSLHDTFTPVYAERQACTINSEGRMSARSIVITEYCNGGDIESHGVRRQDEATLQKCAAALNIYGQMGRILEKIRRDGCAFPDMKNTNWLIDEHNTVRLADTKSFLFTDKQGTINLSESKERWYNLLTTGYMNPPEFASLSAFSADKMHAFMLGKNLYQYLTNCSWRELLDKTAIELDFKHELFNSEEGRMFKTLIKELAYPNASDRISVHVALKELDKINIFILKKECQNTLDELKSAGLPQHRQELTALQHKVFQQHSLPELRALKDNIIEKKAELIAAFKERCYQTLYQLKKEFAAGNEELFHQMKETIKNLHSIPSLLSFEREKRQEIISTLQIQLIDELNKVRQFSIGTQDQAINTYISEKMQAIHSVSSLQEFKQIKDQLSHDLKRLDNPVVREIQSIIQAFRDKGQSLFAIGMNNKAQRIEHAMANVPLFERGAIVEGSSEAIIAVKEALASHRHLHKQKLYTTGEGTIDEAKAASSYINFKTRLAELKENAEVANKNDSNHELSSPSIR